MLTLIELSVNYLPYLWMGLQLKGRAGIVLCVTVAVRYVHNELLDVCDETYEIKQDLIDVSK